MGGGVTLSPLSSWTRVRGWVRVNPLTRTEPPPARRSPPAADASDGFGPRVHRVHPWVTPAPPPAVIAKTEAEPIIKEKDGVSPYDTMPLPPTPPPPPAVIAKTEAEPTVKERVKVNLYSTMPLRVTHYPPPHTTTTGKPGLTRGELCG